MTQKRCEAVTYGVSADEARRFGLPCGGTIQLVLEPLTRESGMRALLREIEAGHLVARRSISRPARPRCIRRTRPTASPSTARRWRPFTARVTGCW